MITIIAGSRSILNYVIVADAIETSGFRITKVVSGKAPGVDFMGELWAVDNKIPIIPMPANWRPDGPNGRIDKSAGYKRNVEMDKISEALIAVWDGKSDGTRHMIDIAVASNKKIFIRNLAEQTDYWIGVAPVGAKTC